MEILYAEEMKNFNRRVPENLKQLGAMNATCQGSGISFSGSGFFVRRVLGISLSISAPRGRIRGAGRSLGLISSSCGGSLARSWPAAAEFVVRCSRSWVQLPSAWVQHGDAQVVTW